MRQLTAWGVYESMIDTVMKATVIMSDKTEDTTETPTNNGRPGK
jgi:hypothetical protein